MKRLVFEKVFELQIIAAVAALIFALFSQYIGGHYPCEMCMWQRYIFAAVIFIAPFGFMSNKRNFLLGLSSSIFLVGAVVAAFHFGVEQGWWEGLTTCAGSGLTGSIEEMREAIMHAPVVRCDEPTWFLFGISMAGWNVLYSGALSLLGFHALWKQKSI